VLLKAGIALVWVSSLVYWPMKWCANRFWPTPSAPISLSEIPFLTRAAWGVFQFCAFITVAWLFAYGEGDTIRRDELLFIGLSAGSAAYFSTVLASGLLRIFGRGRARRRSFPLKVLPTPSTLSEGLGRIDLRERGRPPAKFHQL
jgi:hypothetical protein